MLLARAEALISTEADSHPEQATTTALELVGPEPTPLRARILGMHAHMLAWQDDVEGARRTADEALELADELGLPRLAADVGMTLTVLSQHLDLGEASRAELEADHRGRPGPG